eukprot:Nitzschia sp. Nitz4//scaffold122_size67431//40989//41894//NITZ4_006087-RA/size67431-processed-gene-0.43-mRNA-1//-1//CDS//3329534409//2071//frame0
MDPSIQWQETSDIVANMCRQEATTYHRNDYLPSLQHTTGEGEVIDGSWRQRIVEWMYGVVDHCNLRRESVAVATYFLDLAASRGLVTCRVDFQLCAMTSLMLSIKLNDSTMVKLDSMVRLGRGLFLESDVIAMESRMLKSFNWHVHPPTPVCFMRQLLRLLSPEASPIARYMIVEVTRFISEISACLYKFVKYPASSMALAAIVIAMERIDLDTLPEWQRQHFSYNIFNYCGLDSGAPDVVHAVEELRVSLNNNVNLQELMRTIDAQCHRGPAITCSRSKDTEMHSPEPISPREVNTESFR